MLESIFKDEAAQKRFHRRPVSDRSSYPWHIDLVPETIRIGDDEIGHPARESAVFLVHGMGEPTRTATAAKLRSGFEDALSKIILWQKDNGKKRIPDDLYLPPPYIREGYWADYPDIRETFEKDWDDFTEEDQDYFSNLWKVRILSTIRTYRWFIRQQLRLLYPRFFKDRKFWSWLMYWPLQITSTTTLTLALIRYKKIVSGFLNDVRLYLDPKGVTERAIVERIDLRVRTRLMQMIGLDWDFRPLSDDKLIDASGKRIRFKRVIWVAHSLGTVISYNVLSDLFHRAEEIEKRKPGDDGYDREQSEGVRLFRDSLYRFITLGSPLDKAAYLFEGRALRPWPRRPRWELLNNGEGKTRKEWWINYYHVLDPVSGSLENPLICGENPPWNQHIGLRYLPGWAHVAYWRDDETLRFILGRTYGKEVLQDRVPNPKPAWLLSILSFLFQVLQIGIAAGIIYALLNWRVVLPKLKVLIGLF